MFGDTDVMGLLFGATEVIGFDEAGMAMVRAKRECRGWKTKDGWRMEDEGWRDNRGGGGRWMSRRLFAALSVLNILCMTLHPTQSSQSLGLDRGPRLPYMPRWNDTMESMLEQ